ncbi:hypothetical protein [Arthrobacter sp. NicSoilC5]|uniref:hypothetical protein n=1 Tax=Arthrobacter sp. NicSoilC5 TaxID=2831000 RepID=UPI001CC59B04|nr:hypothetical protein [Arthrobacter sp. NicSoilC5]BCW79015.1 hypothetical protein NicSoilC5_10340 [Arthrobacter sp. NicSoilC5]
MDGWIIPTGLVEVGPWGLLVGVVAFIFYGVFKGWIIPKPHYDTLMARALAAEASNEKLLQNNSDLTQAAVRNTAVGDTVEKLVTAIQETRQKAGETA